VGGGLLNILQVQHVVLQRLSFLGFQLVIGFPFPGTGGWLLDVWIKRWDHHVFPKGGTANGGGTTKQRVIGPEDRGSFIFPIV